MNVLIETVFENVSLCFLGDGLDSWWRAFSWFSFSVRRLRSVSVSGCGCGADSVQIGSSGILKVGVVNYFSSVVTLDHTVLMKWND